ncbi:hypothetical protein WAI453_005312 [Rhynchosporium graminicola]
MNDRTATETKTKTLGSQSLGNAGRGIGSLRAPSSKLQALKVGRDGREPVVSSHDRFELVFEECLSIELSHIRPLHINTTKTIASSFHFCRPSPAVPHPPWQRNLVLEARRSRAGQCQALLASLSGPILCISSVLVSFHQRSQDLNLAVREFLPSASVVSQPAQFEHRHKHNQSLRTCNPLSLRFPEIFNPNFVQTPAPSGIAHRCPPHEFEASGTQIQLADIR